jgi:hypothetical protein
MMPPDLALYGAFLKIKEVELIDSIKVVCRFVRRFSLPADFDSPLEGALCAARSSIPAANLTLHLD